MLYRSIHIRALYRSPIHQYSHASRRISISKLQQTPILLHSSSNINTTSTPSTSPHSHNHHRFLSTVIDNIGNKGVNLNIPHPPQIEVNVNSENHNEISSSNTQSGIGNVLKEAMNAVGPRFDWTKEEIAEIYYTPLLELVYHSGVLHRRFHTPSAVQMCTLMNIKTGGCTEDCSYCAQSSRYDTGLKATKLSSLEAVLEAARIAKSNGSTRFCLGAAWRDMRGRKSGLRNIKAMIEGVRALDMEVCVTLGMIDSSQAQELKEAGLTAYNHNVDTSREHYPKIITTRTYDERLQTLSNVRNAGINVCSGGILGLGEQPQDHISLLYTVSTLPSHPESFPVNALVPIKGTPLESQPRIPFDSILRTIATARIVLPETIIRIAAGRKCMSEAEQMLCFSAGANAIFTGEKMLTTECNGWEEDGVMFKRWGLVPMKSFERGGWRGGRAVEGVEDVIEGSSSGESLDHCQGKHSTSSASSL